MLDFMTCAESEIPTVPDDLREETDVSLGSFVLIFDDNAEAPIKRTREVVGQALTLAECREGLAFYLTVADSENFTIARL